jgi:hypothetical protein
MAGDYARIQTYGLTAAVPPEGTPHGNTLHRYERVAFEETTDATPLDRCIVGHDHDGLNPGNGIATVTYDVRAIKNDESVGGSWLLRATYRWDSSAQATLIGSVGNILTQNETAAAATMVIGDLAGVDVIACRITGVAATTIRWHIIGMVDSYCDLD